MPETALQVSTRLNRTFPGAVLLASDIVPTAPFPTGSLALDVALGGGWAANQWSEILGEENSGKTFLIFKTIAKNQQLDPDFDTFWLAAEHYDRDQAEALGVDNSRVHVSYTRKMELALDFILTATKSQGFDAVVCDSFPALLPHEEDEKAMIEASMTLGARNFNKFWRKMGEASIRNPTGGDRPFVGLMVNQWRDKVGAWAPNGMVPKTSPGGHGKDYSYYTRVDIKRAEFIKEKRPGVTDQVTVGQEIAVTTIKNKQAAPRQTARLRLYNRPAPILGFKRGDYDLGYEYITLGITYGVVVKKGGWYEFAGQQWQGKEAAQEAILGDKILAEKLSSEVMAAAKDPNSADKLLAVAEDAEEPRRRSRRSR